MVVGREDSGEVGMYVAEQEVHAGGEVGAQLEWEDEMVGGTECGEEVESYDGIDDNIDVHTGVADG